MRRTVLVHMLPVKLVPLQVRQVKQHNPSALVRAGCVKIVRNQNGTATRAVLHGPAAAVSSSAAAVFAPETCWTSTQSAHHNQTQPDNQAASPSWVWSLQCWLMACLWLLLGPAFSPASTKQGFMHLPLAACDCICQVSLAGNGSCAAVASCRTHQTHMTGTKEMRRHCYYHPNMAHGAFDATCDHAVQRVCIALATRGCQQHMPCATLFDW